MSDEAKQVAEIVLAVYSSRIKNGADIEAAKTHILKHLQHTVEEYRRRQPAPGEEPS